ncbi:MAG: Fic family protein [Oligoflexia bacterium]|nr:Fic family protein [Oligoflexia bacterium]
MFKLKLLIIILTLAITTSANISFGCTKELSQFPFECEIQDRYKALTDNFKKNWNVNINDIYIYKTARFIDQNSLAKAIKNKTAPENIYKPAPTTWDYWIKGEKTSEEILKDTYINNSSEDKKAMVSCRLTLNHLKKLHLSTITNELIGPFTSLMSNIIPIENTILLGPGNIRHSTFNFRPFFTFSCSEKVSKKIIPYFDIKDKNGELIAELTYKKCADGESIEGSVYYSKSVKVPERINEFIESFNNKIPSYFAKECTNISPYEFAANIQRWYVSIHPFREGNGRLSRFMQDMISRVFNLPFVPAGYLQNDLLISNSEYQAKTKETVTMMIEKLESCYNNYQKNNGDKKSIDFECRIIE